MELELLRDTIEAAGVIGAGGAGFPTHRKLARGIDTVLVNAAECEPLLYTDFTILREHLDRVCEGARELCDAMGAAQVLVAMKEHTALRLGVAQGEELPCGARAALLPDVYPMGDEIIMIYQALGRVVPPGQLPSAVGVVVVNAETAYNVSNAVRGAPVTEKWLTIGGAVEHPVVVRVPVNCGVRAVLRAAGVTVPTGHVVVDGGPAMGNIVNPASAVVTKKTKALLILPEEIPAIANKAAPVERLLKRVPSACCQCMYCTELCPRHLLGYPLQPHKTLRAVGAGAPGNPEELLTASLCSGCGVCTLMACCQGIAPSAAMTAVKQSLGRHRIGYRADGPTKPDSERDFRMVPVSRFKSRIGVAKFDREAEWAGDLPVAQALWRLPLSQHVGKPSEPVVAVGDEVAAGQLIARAREGISAALHAPVAGTISRVTDTEIEMTRGEVK